MGGLCLSLARMHPVPFLRLFDNLESSRGTMWGCLSIFASNLAQVCFWCGC